MSVSQPSRRLAGLLPAVLIGGPLTAAVFAAVYLTPLRDTVLERYVAHWVEKAEVILFCAAIGLLTAKLVQTLWERFAGAREPLPKWDGRAVSVTEANTLLATVNALPAHRRASAIGRRAADVLGYLARRGSPQELDDHLRDLSDAEADSLEGGYGLVKFITWAIPILGFLGTVLGITDAIAGVNPEVLEKDLSAVTDGLATAFDTTAAALALTMVLMFYSFVVDKLEQSVRKRVDAYAGDELAHRFERSSAESAPYLDALRQHSHVLLGAVEQSVRRQADVWAESLAVLTSQRNEDQKQVTAALEETLSRSLQGHARQAAALQEQAATVSSRLVQQMKEFQEAVQEAASEQREALSRVADTIAGQARVLAGLQAGEQQLRRLHEGVDRSLNLTANADTLQQAVHSLTAAIHLLTARAEPRPRVEPRPPGDARAA